MSKQDSPYSFILDGMNWSFSSVNTYETCPYCFKLSYIDRKPQEQNAFSEWGTFCHSILERYFKGEIELFDLVDTYKNEYGKNVKHDFPPNKFVNLSESYYKAGLNYFSNFDGVEDGMEVVGVEQKIRTKIKNYSFVGVIDLILRNTSGNLIIQDHKSKKAFKNKSDTLRFLRQPYLYSLWIKEHFYSHPEELRFNMIRGNEVLKFPFDEELSKQAEDWFVNTIDKIYEDTTFQMNYDQFFCHNLCSVRNHCIGGDV